MGVYFYGDLYYNKRKTQKQVITCILKINTKERKCMAKYCCKCGKRMRFFSATYFIGDQVFCGDCVDNVSEACKDSKNINENLDETEILYSGLIAKSGIKTHPVQDEVITEKEIESNLTKINNLPKKIKTKILKIPQFKIFFENDIPYYISQNIFQKKELPKRKGSGWYYDPVEKTAGYKLVIDDVKKMAEKEYEAEMIKEFGTRNVLGGVHRYYAIEANILYEKYGICCINNPMYLNPGLHID